MKKFVFLYNVSVEEENGKDETDAWMSWFHLIGKNMVDMGNPLVGGKEVKPQGVTDVTLEMGMVSGYSIVNAIDMDGAIEMARGCPGQMGVRVYESVPM